MKKVLSLSLVMLLVLSLFLVLISCNMNQNNNDNSLDNNLSEDNQNNSTDDENSNVNDSEKDEPGGDDTSVNEPFVLDLSGYVANITNATAIGISRKSGSGVSTAVLNGKLSTGIQLLSATTLNSGKNNVDKNYIVMTTTDYGANSPETDENGISKITFTKIVTENATTEITGTKYIKANKGQISIHATEGFRYSVYDGETLIYDAVADDDLTDKKNKKGIIVLDNLTDGVTYKVTYAGLGIETTITQDEINGEIDKLYVMDDYTFICFVPEGKSERPLDADLTYDETGVAVYDKKGFFSDNMHQSFVINNATGYVYQLKDVVIDEIKNNLLMIADKIYDMRVNDENELQFYTVVQNETLNIYSFFKDKYGNKYICNDFLNAVDEDNNTVYYTEQNKYLFSSKDSIAVCNYHKIIENFKEAEFSADEKYTLDVVVSKYDYTSSMIVIEEGYYYVMNPNSAYRVNLETMEKEFANSCYYVDQNGFYYNAKTIVTCYYESGDDTSKCNLYFANLYGENALKHADEIIENGNKMSSMAEMIVEDVVVSAVGNLFGCDGWTFRKTTITETVYYKVTVGEDGKPNVVDSKYISPERDIITLQPINK